MTAHLTALLALATLLAIVARPSHTITVCNFGEFPVSVTAGHYSSHLIPWGESAVQSGDCVGFRTTGYLIEAGHMIVVEGPLGRTSHRTTVMRGVVDSAVFAVLHSNGEVLPATWYRE